MFFTDIFPDLNCLNLCGTNVSQSIKPMNNNTTSTQRQRDLKTAFSLWTHIKCFSVHTTAEKFEKATIICHFGFVFEEKPCRESTWLSCSHPFEKLCFERFIFKRTNVFHWFFSPYFNCFNLFVTKVTQSIKPMNYVYHAWLITPRSQYARKFWKRRFTLKLVTTYNSYKIPYFC